MSPSPNTRVFDWRIHGKIILCPSLSPRVLVKMEEYMYSLCCTGARRLHSAYEQIVSRKVIYRGSIIKRDQIMVSAGENTVCCWLVASNYRIAK